MDPPSINAVYYPSWRVYKDLPPSSLQIRCITHIFYAFLRLNNDGTVRFLDAWADTMIDVDGEKGCLAALAKLKRQHPHLKTILSVGGGGGSDQFPVVAANEASRQIFAREVRSLVDRYSFSGVDIDWEHPKDAADGVMYLRLLRTLRDHLPARQYLITTALPVQFHCLKNISMQELSKVVDFIGLMAFDLTGPWSAHTGHHAQLLPHPNPRCVPLDVRGSGHHGVDYIISQGFPRHKLLLGVPAFARGFPGTTAACIPHAGPHVEIDYRHLPTKWIDSAIVDSTLGAASFVDVQEKGFLSLDVPATVRQKAGYVRAMGLGGLFYWNGAGDVKGGPRSLIAAGWNGLREL